jgi:SAM-dependent methyltransferase
MMDIGGGLRIDAARGNCVNTLMQSQFSQYLKNPNVHYKVTDYTDQYHPDFVEDIHKLSFADASVDGLFCMAVLEHVYDPKKAAEEIMRVLKKDAEAFLYVPFIYRYHANSTEDYKDYFRYSKDGIAYLFRDCSSITICPVRGIFESLLRFIPLHRFSPFNLLCRIIDWQIPAIRNISERQTSGYFIHLVK